MPKVTNISDGPRGAYHKGVLVMANPGETIEADDFAKEWFKGGKADADEGSGAPAEKPLAKMNKTELLAIASDEKVEVADDATNAQLVAAIENARAAAQ